MASPHSVRPSQRSRGRSVRRKGRPAHHLICATEPREIQTRGVTLSRIGRREEALGATEEGVAIYRRLATARLNAFEPDLATTLGNLGLDLDDLGRSEKALAVTEQAVAIRRRLAAAQPQAFEPNLANSLGSLSERFLPFGRAAEAIAAAEEGIAMLTPHHSRFPTVHQELWDKPHASLAKARTAVDADGASE